MRESVAWAQAPRTGSGTIPSTEQPLLRMKVATIEFDKMYVTRPRFAFVVSDGNGSIT